MDINTIAQLVGSVGFPIVMCAWMMKRMESQDDKHREEIAELRKVVEENTVAVVRLCEKMEG